VTWSGGTYHPFLDGDTDLGQSDLWWATGKFSISNAELAPAALDGERYPIMPVSGYHWTILQADGGFTANSQPSYNNAIWLLKPVKNASNTVIKWDLWAV
jgi:hypothetical protein